MHIYMLIYLEHLFLKYCIINYDLKNYKIELESNELWTILKLKCCIF